MALKIGKLNITNVSHHENEFFINGFDILFEIDGFQYNLSLSPCEGEDHRIHPNYIEHITGEKCTFCKEAVFSCRVLTKHKHELFHRLIEFPSIRLHWLFIKHA